MSGIDKLIRRIVMQLYLEGKTERLDDSSKDMKHYFRIFFGCLVS